MNVVLVIIIFIINHIDINVYFIIRVRFVVIFIENDFANQLSKLDF